MLKRQEAISNMKISESIKLTGKDEYITKFRILKYYKMVIC